MRLQGLMEEEEADRLSVRHSLLLDVELLGSKPTFFSLSPGPSLCSVQGLF